MMIDDWDDSSTVVTTAEFRNQEKYGARKMQHKNKNENWNTNGKANNRRRETFNNRNDNWGGDVAAPKSNNWRHEAFDNRSDNWGDTAASKSNHWQPEVSSNKNDGWGNTGISKSNNRRNESYGKPNFVNIEVPSRCVGRIIGKGGAKISDLQFESGARIQVTKEVVGDNTIIKLSGAPEEIEKAKEMIIELTIDRPPREKIVFQTNTLESTNDQVQQVHPELESATIDWKALAQECDRHTQEFWAKAPPIKKDFYVEDPAVTNMTPEEIEYFRETHNNIVVSRVFEEKCQKKSIPNPIQTFEQAFHNYPLILDEIKKVGFESPSPIQSQAWPILLSGEDLIGIAQTGTGKTLAFLLPALIHIDGQVIPRVEREGPSVLVLAPTRELALQIDREVKKYQYKDITAVCIYGGGSRKQQVDIVTKGVDIVIATPGRLNDLVNDGHISVKSITYVVLDEADRMLDMGFEPQIRRVLYTIRPDRQTVMTSATWPLGVRRLADSYMENPIQVYVGSLDLAAVHSVTQTIVMMPDDENEKFNMFIEFVINMQPEEKVIVFCGKKTRADHLATELILKNISCQVIHGDLEQSDREQAIADITDGTVQILIATDVASRGIDIEDITHVINYDFPRNIEEYVHRVGRTGRAGRLGNSISYFTRSDWANAKEVIPILEEADQHVPDELYQMSERYEAWKERKDKERYRGGGRGQGGRRW